jgi:hypothetical protein
VNHDGDELEINKNTQIEISDSNFNNTNKTIDQLKLMVTGQHLNLLFNLCTLNGMAVIESLVKLTVKN